VAHSDRGSAQRVSLQATFVLHHRPFRDTSVIANLLTPDLGRVDVVARGVRSAKSRRRHLLQPFRPLLASWVGRSELSTLTTLEESGVAYPLSGEALGCAYYVTELALRLVPRQAPAVEIFALYAGTLQTLAGLDEKSVAGAPTNSVQMECLMRGYETGLLDALGLLPDLTHSDVSGAALSPESLYRFDAINGTSTSADHVAVDTLSVHGKTLLGIAGKDFSDALVRSESKQIMRAMLRPHLGDQPLNSRAVFRQLMQTRPPNSNVSTDTSSED